MDDVLKRIMKRRGSGPERQKVRAHAEKASYTIIQKVNQMMNKWPEKEERERLKWKLMVSLGYMMSKTTANADREICEEADRQSPVKRQSTHNEWQRSHKTDNECHWCHHEYCGHEDFDESDLDSDEEQRERRGPIMCGYDITESGNIYCCICKNRFGTRTPPGVYPYGHGAHNAIAGRHGAESPTEMTSLPVMKTQRTNDPQNPVFNVKRPQPIHQPQTIHELRDAERFRSMEEIARQPAEAEAEVYGQPIAGENMAEDVAKCVPEGGYVENEDGSSAPPLSPASPAWSPPPSPPPSPPESPPPSPPESPPPSPPESSPPESPPPSPPTSPDASSV